jgi:hypothetical protein
MSLVTSIHPHLACAPHEELAQLLSCQVATAAGVPLVKHEQRLVAQSVNGLSVGERCHGVNAAAAAAAGCGRF